MKLFQWSKYVYIQAGNFQQAKIHKCWGKALGLEEGYCRFPGWLIWRPKPKKWFSEQGLDPNEGWETRKEDNFISLDLQDVRTQWGCGCSHMEIAWGFEIPLFIKLRLCCYCCRIQRLSWKAVVYHFSG